MTTQATTAEKSEQKLVFRVPAELHAAIQERARQEDRSMASWIRRALESAVASEKQT